MLPAVLAALALLTQLLIPGVSLAVEADPAGPTSVMCTANGAVSVIAPAGPDSHKSFGGLKCHDCVMASVAAIGSEIQLSVPVRYAARVEIALPGQNRPQTRGRAPPRPPSTAPPLALNA